MGELIHQYIDAWQALLHGDADQRTVRTARQISMCLAMAGSTLFAVAAAGLLFS
ncbi:MAG: hypothetical protein R3228_07645 [Halioglobus sp.]|nr:hypothetical protein [Halioglobus sp.]